MPTAWPLHGDEVQFIIGPAKTPARFTPTDHALRSEVVLIDEWRSVISIDHGISEIPKEVFGSAQG